MPNRMFMPHGLDDMEKFMIWDVDVLAVFVGMIGLGIFINSFLICTFLGSIMSKLLSRLKYGKPEGYLFHLLYWLGAAKLKYLPESYIREFME